MSIRGHVVAEVREALARGERSEAWARLDYLSLPAPLRRLLRRHIADLKAFEKALSRVRRGKGAKWAEEASEATPPEAPGENVARIGGQGPYKRDGGRPCKVCGEPWPHAPRTLARKKHMWVLQQKHRVLKSWRSRPPGSAARRARMERAWAGRRRAKDDRIIANTHPRLVKLLGRAEVIRRARNAELPRPKARAKPPVSDRSAEHVGLRS